MSLSAVQLCARALVKLGCTPIAAFDEPGAEAEVARNLYAPARDALLAAHPWSFAVRQTALARLADAPAADFAFAYAAPLDCLRVLSLGEGARGRGEPYRLAAGLLHTDAERPVLTYVARVAEADFPPHFAWPLIARLAAEFCLPLTESSSRAQALLETAEAELRRARLVDSQQSTPAAIEDFTLIGARHG